MTTEEAIANATRTISFGHLCDGTDGYEYFEVRREVYRAPLNNPMGTNGYRQGARPECALERFNDFRARRGF